MRVLGSGHPGGVPAAIRVERRRDERSQVYLHQCHGLQLSRVPLLRHDHLSRSADRGFLRPHIPGNRKTGQSHEREIPRVEKWQWSWREEIVKAKNSQRV